MLRTRWSWWYRWWTRRGVPLRPGRATGDRPTDPEVRTRQILEGVPMVTRNHIDNLVDEVGLVEQHEPRGGRAFIFHQRTEEWVCGVDLGPMVDEEIERLLAHVADDAEVRRFVAALLDIDTEGLEPEEVVEAIRDRFFAVKDEEEQMELFDKVGQEIEAPDIDKGIHATGYD